MSDSNSEPRKNGVNTPPRGRPFEKGNPGRPRGSANKTTLAAKMLLEGKAEAITKKCVELALQGDMTAIRLCLERLLPTCRPELSDLAERVAEIEAADAAHRGLLN